jgi:hypothetical protein
VAPRHTILTAFASQHPDAHRLEIDRHEKLMAELQPEFPDVFAAIADAHDKIERVRMGVLPSNCCYCIVKH